MEGEKEYKIERGTRELSREGVKQDMQYISRRKGVNM